MAQGEQVPVASAGNDTAYGVVGGTSLSCPQVAGIAALILRAHPGITPYDVITRLHATGSNAGAPNNLIGWGIANAMAAVIQPLMSNTPAPWILYLVGAIMALGSHPCRGTSAALTPRPKKSRMKARRANCGPIIAIPGLPPGTKSRVLPMPMMAMIPARMDTPPH